MRRLADQAARGGGQSIVVGQQHAAAAGGDDLVAVEAEHADVAERSDVAAAVAHAHRLRRVLDDRQAMAARHLHERSISQAMPSRWAATSARTRRPLRRLVVRPRRVTQSSVRNAAIWSASICQVSGSRIDEHRLAAALAHRMQRSDEGQIGNDDLLARAHADQLQRDVQRGAARHRRHGMARSDVLRHGALEAADERSGRRDPTGIETLAQVAPLAAGEMRPVQRDHGAGARRAGALRHNGARQAQRRGRSEVGIADLAGAHHRGRRADRDDAVADVAHHRGAGADDRVLADRHAVNDRGADREHRKRTDRRPAAGRRPGPSVAKSPMAASWPTVA